MTRLLYFVQAITCLLSFFIISYAIKMGVAHDPDIRGIELIVMLITGVLCFITGLNHIHTMVFLPSLHPPKEYDEI